MTSLYASPTAGGERWTRSFGDRPLTTVQWRRGALLVEAHGLVASEGGATAGMEPAS